jgi:hypothetical protein
MPDHLRAEIIDGTLHVSPRPLTDHQYTNGALTRSSAALTCTIRTAPEAGGSNTSYDRDSKMPFSARLGIEWAWLVDTEKRDIETYQLRDRAYARVPVTLGPEARLPPFETIALPVDRFWL